MPYVARLAAGGLAGLTVDFSIILACFALVGAGHVGWLLLSLGMGRSWRKAAEAAGVGDLGEGKVFGAVTRVTGRRGLLDVDLQPGDRKRILITVVCVRGILPGIVLRRELPPDAPDRAAPPHLDTETGDATFDREVEVHGSNATLRALLDAETRAAVLGLFRERVEATIEEGELRAYVRPAGLRPNYPALPGILRQMLDLGDRLLRPDDIPGRLLHNVRSDRLPGVRLRNLMTLVREFPQHASTREALAAACGDRSDEVRLRAALSLGADGRGLLREIASAEDADDGCAAQAVGALGAEVPAPVVLGILRRALRARRLRTAEACLAWLGRHGQGEGLEALAKVLAVEKGALAVAAAQALGDTSRPEAEDPLIRALARPVEGLCVAAVDALALVGSAAAVIPLQEAAAGHADDRVLAQAARRAIATIQERLGGTPGALSLAEGEAGQLALPDDTAGQVSLTPPRSRPSEP